MDRQKLTELYHKYQLKKEHFFNLQLGGKKVTIIKREGIDKIQGMEQINITYDVIQCEPNFSVFKAIATKGNKKIETFGSALKGGYKDGNCASWYVAEMAEKRAMSRAVLKLTGFYELGIFGEDESDSFKEADKKKSTKQEIINKIKNN